MENNRLGKSLMKARKCCILLTLFVPFISAKAPFDLLRRNLASVSSDAEQTRAVDALLVRLLGNASSLFSVAVDASLTDADGRDVAHVDSISKAVSIQASSGSAAAFAAHHFLKYQCGCHIAWEFEQLSLPDPLPTAEYTIRANDLVRYYANVCTFGYSFAWWRWKDWQRHIDWMALSGLNLVLADSGQELVWARTFRQFGMTEHELERHFAGPAFLPWNRMGNMNGWGGPLSSAWMDADRSLQRKILRRLRSLGIAAVTPAFSGIVPDSLAAKHPNVTCSKLRHWGDLPDNLTSSCVLDFNSSLFRAIAEAFGRNYQSEYGRSSHFYSADAFNEMSPPFGDPQYIADYGAATMASLASVNARAVWVLQGWMLRNESFWSESRSRALLTSTARGRMLVLDLAATTSPQFDRLESFFGQPFVYCMLHNYGATQGLYGKASTVNTAPFGARANTVSMAGMGLTPEGLHNTYAMYELMTEMMWRAQPLPDVTVWFEALALRRYGPKVIEKKSASLAWNILANSALNCCRNITVTRHSGLSAIEPEEFRFHGSKTALTSMPSLHIKDQLWYDPKQMLKAWDVLLVVAEAQHRAGLLTEALAYDLVDVSRQAMANALSSVYTLMTSSYETKSKSQLLQHGRTFLAMATDLDALLAISEHFLLGAWLRDARRSGTADEADLLEFNARVQITSWGPVHVDSANLRDYAAKQWSGLVTAYYLPRWRLFLHWLIKSLESGRPFDQKAFERTVAEKITAPFTSGSEKYPFRPRGNPVEVSRKLHRKWRVILETLLHYRPERSSKFRTKN